MKESMIVWGVTISPYVQKVMIALEEKALAYELRETLPTALLEAKSMEVPLAFSQCSPLGKIPALQVGSFMLSDSSVIADFLDQQYGSGNSLYPTQPELRARARWFEMYSDTVLTSVLYNKIFVEMVVKPNVLAIAPNRELVTHAYSEELPPLLDFLNDSLDEKQWFAGDHFSMADAAVITQLMALELSGYPLSVDEHPHLVRLIHQGKKRPSLSWATDREGER